MRVDRPTFESAPSGRLAALNSLQGPTRSRPVREFRTSGVVCVSCPPTSTFPVKFRLAHSLTAGSPRESPALAAQLRAFSVISSSLRAELSTSRNHSTGKVSAFADVFSYRSHPLTVCQRYCGRRRLLSSPSISAMLSGRGSLIHASQALRPEKRGSPLPMGRTGTDFIPLPLHCVRTRPAGKEVRLRLDFFDARFILSGSVVHFVPGTSSEGERRRETVTAGVPLLSTPSLPDSQSGIAPLSLRSLLCRA